MRKLATIRRIQEIKSIANADSICAYRLDNWWVVDGIGKYAVGELVVYCEPDSWIPHTLAPFLSKGQYPRVYDGIEGERLRTVKLRGQVSQGLILPLHCVWSGAHINMPYIGMSPWDFQGDWEQDDHTLNEVDIFVNGQWSIGTIEGLDVSSRLGILKYDPPVSAQLAGISKGAFPSCFPKTDEERIQNLTSQWPELQEQEYEITEKLEGSSMSVGLLEGDAVPRDGEFIVCSRNLNLKEVEGNTLWSLARKHDIERKLREIGPPDGIILQGEIIGEGIQGNYYGIKGHEFYVFAVYDIGMGRYYFPEERRRMCEHLGLKHVPVISTNGSLKGMTIDEVLKSADGMSQVNPTKRREGLVYKRADGKNGQEHFKAVSNEYLLKTGG